MAERVPNAVDTVLGTRTCGNRTLFRSSIALASGGSEAEEFARETFMNGEALSDMFLWGRLESDGTCKTVGNQLIQGSPSCLIASDLYRLATYLESNQETCRGIVINGSAPFAHDWQKLDEILGLDLPVLVLLDLHDTECLPELQKRDFRTWQWSNKILQQTPVINGDASSPFFLLGQTVRAYCSRHYGTEPVDHAKLQEAFEEARALEEYLSDRSLLGQSYNSLWRILLDLSRLLWQPSSDWVKTTQDKLARIRLEFSGARVWLSVEANEKAMRLIDCLIAVLLAFYQEPPPKVRNLASWVEALGEGEKLSVVLARLECVEQAKEFWRQKMSKEKFKAIRFLTLKELEGSVDPDTQLLVCGWLGWQKMNQLLNGLHSACITVLTYPFELRWFQHAHNCWKNRNMAAISTADLARILQTSEDAVKGIASEVEPIEVPEEGTDDPQVFELKLQNLYIKSWAKGGNLQGESVNARLVIFPQKQFAFLTETHRIPVVTEVVRKRITKGMIPMLCVVDLREGDWVLFHESNRNVIAEIADDALERAGRIEQKSVANLWRLALQKRYDKLGFSVDLLVSELKQQKCYRHPVTVYNWIHFEDIIGPRDQDALQAIAIVAHDRKLSDRLDEVWQAISEVRGAHLQASTYMRNQLLSRLPNLIEGQLSDQGFYVLNLERFGQVTLLQIEEVGDSWDKIPKSGVNCLLRQED
jgi:hypothetical protein